MTQEPQSEPGVTLETINQKLDQLLEERELSNSPYLAGDAAAAQFAGIKSPKTFRHWAKQKGIKPQQDGGVTSTKYWSRAEIIKARNQK